MIVLVVGAFSEIYFALQYPVLPANIIFAQELDSDITSTFEPLAIAPIRFPFIDGSFLKLRLSVVYLTLILSVEASSTPPKAKTDAIVNPVVTIILFIFLSLILLKA